jgi:hypothetical protein
MKTWKVVSGIALVFVVGILVGSLGTHVVLRHRFPPPHPGPKAAFLVERLSRDLSLTESQKARVKQILDQTDEKLHQHFQQVEPQVKKIVDDSFAEIGKELTDEQRKKLDLIRQRFERKTQIAPPKQ